MKRRARPVNIGLIRVATRKNKELLNKHGYLIEEAFPDLQVRSVCIEDQPYGIYDKESEETAKPKVINLARGLQREVEVIIISCAADPGIEELKEELQVPVVGAGASLAAVSRVLGNSVGVITITDCVPEAVRRGLGKSCFAWEQVEGVRIGRDLESEASHRNTLNAARRLQELGSNLIALACTGFSAMQIALEISRKLSITVVDPLLAAGSIAYGLMSTMAGKEDRGVDEQ